MTRRLGRPFQSDAVETRTRILREARLAFTTRGYDNTTNREISAGAGITAAAIYHYFPSKVDLFVFEHDHPVNFERTLSESHAFMKQQLG